MLEPPDVGALMGKIHVLLTVEDTLGRFMGFLKGGVEVAVVAVATALPPAEELLHLGSGVLAYNVDGCARLFGDSHHSGTPLVVGLGS